MFLIRCSLHFPVREIFSYRKMETLYTLLQLEAARACTVLHFKVIFIRLYGIK